MLGAYRASTCSNCQLTGFVLLFPVLHQFGQNIELASTFRPTQILCFLVSHYLGLEFERECASLQLFFLDAFEYVILLPCFHLLAFVKYSTKSLQDQALPGDTYSAK